MSRKIGNVGVLDLRKATEESVKNIDQIHNVGLVIYSPETAPLMAGLNIGNMGSSVEVGMEYKLFTGQHELSRDVLEAVNEPMSLVVTGEFVVKSELTRILKVSRSTLFW